MSNETTRAWIGFRFLNGDETPDDRAIYVFDPQHGAGVAVRTPTDVLEATNHMLRGVKERVITAVGNVTEGCEPENPAVMELVGDMDEPPAGYLFCVDLAGGPNPLLMDEALTAAPTRTLTLATLDLMLDYSEQWCRNIRHPLDRSMVERMLGMIAGDEDEDGDGDGHDGQNEVR